MPPQLWSWGGKCPPCPPSSAAYVYYQTSWFVYSAPTLYATWWIFQAEYHDSAGSNDVSMNRREWLQQKGSKQVLEMNAPLVIMVKCSMDSAVYTHVLWKYPSSYMLFNLCIGIKSYIMCRVSLYTVGQIKAANIMLQICTWWLKFKIPGTITAPICTAEKERPKLTSLTKLHTQTHLQ